MQRVRPELDIYLVSNRAVEELAGDPRANVARRIFYSVEELLELEVDDEVEVLLVTLPEVEVLVETLPDDDEVVVLVIPPVEVEVEVEPLF